MSGLTPAELAQVRHATEDRAGSWYAMPGIGRDSTARYVAEGALRKLVDRHGLGPVWQAVAEVIDADPTVLGHQYTQAELDDRHAARRTAADEVDNAAKVAFDAGDFDRTLKLVDEAELCAPDYHDWDRIREFVRAAAREAAEQPGGPQ